MVHSSSSQPLGLPLVPAQLECYMCRARLLVRADRPSKLTLYTKSMGTILATHYHKYCSNYRKGCKLVHFYRYYPMGDGEMHYTDDALSPQYFLSTQETGFETSMLHKFDAELLIGQMSHRMLTFLIFHLGMMSL